MQGFRDRGGSPAQPLQGSSMYTVPDDLAADGEDGDLEAVVYSEYMSADEIADLLVSANPDRVDTSVYSDFYTFLLQNMWRFSHNETMFKTIVDAMFIRARPCSVRDLEEQEQGTENLTALLRVVYVFSNDIENLTVGGKQLLERIWAIILQHPDFLTQIGEFN